MNIHKKEVETIELSKLVPGGVFKLRSNNNVHHYMKIDLSTEVVFSQMVLCAEIIYCVKLLNGSVTGFESNLIVRKIELEATEI